MVRAHTNEAEIAIRPTSPRRSFFDHVKGRSGTADFESDGAIRFERVNVDESPSVATALKVMSIPTIIVFDADGHENEREIGLPGKRRLDRLIRSAESLTDTTIGQGAA